MGQQLIETAPRNAEIIVTYSSTLFGKPVICMTFAKYNHIDKCWYETDDDHRLNPKGTPIKPEFWISVDPEEFEIQ